MTGPVLRQYLRATETQQRARLVAAGIAALFLAGHVAWLASTLEDIDSVNFALGIHEFDPAKHQPHPPGYPIFMALAKASYAVVHRDAPALAIWGAILGALAVFPLVRLFMAIEALEGSADSFRRLVRSIAAAVVTMTAPLFWFTASRPMSDVAGLVFTLTAQAVLLSAFVRQGVAGQAATRESIAASGRLIVLGACLSAIALGFRAQAAWLTVPLLIVVIVDRTGRGAAGAMLGSAMTFAAGVLSWAVPLIVASGGISRYLGALGAQAGEDIGGVDMLVSTPTLRHLAGDLQHTFIRPWGALPLAIVVLAAAAAGLCAVAIRSRRALVGLLAAFAPYLAFHIVFQETVTARYALPLVPAMAYLAVRGLDAVHARLTGPGAAVIAAASLILTVPALRIYAREGSPFARAAADIRTRTEAGPRRPLAMHYAFVRALRREPPPGVPVLDVRPRMEWLSLVQYWQGGNRAPVWFLADPFRTDLALIDPASMTVVQQYAWHIPTDWFLSGIRPDALRWIEIGPPGWYLEEGWALTPETAGIATLQKRSPADAPIVGRVRRSGGPRVLLIGGRNLGAAGDPDVRFTTKIDGTVIDEVVAKPMPGFFLRMVPLNPDVLTGAGLAFPSGPSDYATLQASAAAADGSGHPVKAAFEQFNLQPASSTVFGFDTGWYEFEYSPALRRTFRWSSARADILVHHGAGDVSLHLTGESPLRYFDAAPHVTVRAGDRVLATFAPEGDFDETIQVPTAALDAAGGRVTVTTDRTFVPAERSGSPDRRALGLRFFSVTVQ